MSASEQMHGSLAEPLRGSAGEIVRYRPEYREQVIELQTQLWSPDPSLNSAYLAWKHEQNPYLRTPLLYLALQSGRVVAMRGFFGVQWEVGSGQRCLGLYADDAVVAPAERNRGLMAKIMRTAVVELREQGFDYLFNLSAGEVTFLASLAQGWRSVGSLGPMQLQPLRATLRGAVRRTLTGLPGTPRLLERLRPLRERTTLRPLLAELGEREHPPELRAFPRISVSAASRPIEMAALVERVKGCDKIRHVRDAEYFAWRFQNPLQRYRFLFWSRERLEGYLVLQEPVSPFQGARGVNIVDWEGSSLEIRAELLRAARKLVKHAALGVQAATLPEASLELLARNGFRPRESASSVARQLPALLIRSLHDLPAREWQLGGLPLMQLASWDLRMLYSMAA